MHLTLSSWAPALILCSLFSSSLALQHKFDEVYRRNAFAIDRKFKEQAHKRDQICYDDEILLAFKYDLSDAGPFCSILLGISDSTTTSKVTAKKYESSRILISLL